MTISFLDHYQQLKSQWQSFNCEAMKTMVVSVKPNFQKFRFWWPNALSYFSCCSWWVSERQLPIKFGTVHVDSPQSCGHLHLPTHTSPDGNILVTLHLFLFHQIDVFDFYGIRLNNRAELGRLDRYLKSVLMSFGAGRFVSGRVSRRGGMCVRQDDKNIIPSDGLDCSSEFEYKTCSNENQDHTDYRMSMMENIQMYLYSILLKTTVLPTLARWLFFFLFSRWL